MASRARRFGRALLGVVGDALAAMPDARPADRTAEGARPADSVKLLHSDDLRRMSRFPRCQDHDGITLAEYRVRAKELARRRRSVRHVLAAREELAALDRDDDVEVGEELIPVPRSIVPREVALPLGAPPTPGLVIAASEGVVRDGAVIVRAEWRERSVRIVWRGPSRIAYAPRIAELRGRLDETTAAARSVADEVRASRFGHPVLFVSHRWLGRDHPDPEGAHLDRLRELEDCWLIYDYSAFPQPPRSEQEQATFEAILAAMDELIESVVVLAHPDYLTRGWCVYEYLVAAISRSTVLDEVADERFTDLRDWAHTLRPFSLSLRESFEAQQENYIATRVLEAVERVLPIYAAATFRDEHDSSMVTSLLVEHLRDALPPKRRDIPHFGEWTSEHWSRDEIRAALTAGLVETDGRDDSVPISRTRTEVPRTVSEAVAGRYGELGRRPWGEAILEALNPTTSLTRMIEEQRATRPSKRPR